MPPALGDVDVITCPARVGRAACRAGATPLPHGALRLGAARLATRLLVRHLQLLLQPHALLVGEVDREGGRRAVVRRWLRLKIKLPPMREQIGGPPGSSRHCVKNKKVEHKHHDEGGGGGSGALARKAIPQGLLPVRRFISPHLTNHVGLEPWSSHA